MPLRASLAAFFSFTEFFRSLLGPRTRRFHPVTPGCPMFEHGVQDDRQFAHACRQRQLLRLPRLAESLIERPNDGIEPGATIAPIYRSAPGLCPASPDCAFPAQQPAIATEGRPPHQGRNLLVRQGPQLRYGREQRGGEDRAHARRAP